jgi:putative endonuclease
MPKNRRFFVYIMTNRPRSHVLYTGVTGDLPRRVFQHKNKIVPGFTSRYNSPAWFTTKNLSIPMSRLIEKKKSKGGVAARRFG